MRQLHPFLLPLGLLLLPALSVSQVPEEGLLAGSADSALDSASDPSLTFDLECMVCHWGAQILVDYQKTGKTMDEFLSVTSTMCHLFGIESKVEKGGKRELNTEVF